MYHVHNFKQFNSVFDPLKGRVVHFAVDTEGRMFEWHPGDQVIAEAPTLSIDYDSVGNPHRFKDRKVLGLKNVGWRRVLTPELKPCPEGYTIQ